MDLQAYIWKNKSLALRSLLTKETNESLMGHSPPVECIQEESVLLIIFCLSDLFHPPSIKFRKRRGKAVGLPSFPHCHFMFNTPTVAKFASFSHAQQYVGKFSEDTTCACSRSCMGRGSRFLHDLLVRMAQTDPLSKIVAALLSIPQIPLISDASVVLTPSR